MRELPFISAITSDNMNLLVTQNIIHILNGLKSDVPFFNLKTLSFQVAVV